MKKIITCFRRLLCVKNFKKISKTKLTELNVAI